MGSTHPQPETPRAPPVDGFPLVGALPEILARGVEYLVDARRRHGDVYVIDAAVAKIIAFNHPSHAQHILRDNARNYRKGGPLWESVRSLIGNGLPVSEGEFWLRQRRMMQPHFHHERLAEMLELMVRAIDDGIAGWDEIAARGGTIDVARELTRITMKVIVATMFGSAISTEEADSVGESMTYAIDYMLRAMATRSLPSWVPLPGRRRFEECIRAIDRVIFDVISRRRAVTTGGGALIEMLLDMVDTETGERMTDQQLRDEAVSIFLAGYETTAAALAWTFHFLTQRPDLLEPIEQEVAGLSDRRPTFGDLPHLSRSLAALQESLRMYPVVYWLPRTAIEEDRVGGFVVPRGALVGVMTYAIHRHPQIWPNPNEFDPGRFSAERSSTRPPLSWLPFGGGQRLCVGKDFAMAEGQLILVRVLQRYRIESVPGRRAELHVSTTLRTKNGVWLRLAHRHRN